MGYDLGPVLSAPQKHPKSALVKALEGPDNWVAWFANGYLEALLFAEREFTGDNDPDHSLQDAGYGITDFTRKSLSSAILDCAAFFTGNQSLLEKTPFWGSGEGLCRAGNHFYFARQGHGVAWTDDYWKEPEEVDKALRVLQDLSRKSGEVYIDVYRKKIHIHTYESRIAVIDGETSK
jgi:hypothetical protein